MQEQKVLLNCAQILTMADEGLGIIAGGALRIKGERVVEIGRGLQPEPGEERIDCQNSVVMPGFVDPHTHLVFASWRADEFEMRLLGKSYKEILEAGGGILATVKMTREASEDELFQTALGRLKEMVSWGTTTVEVKSGYGLDKENELKLLRVVKRLNEAGLIEVIPTFMGAHAVPKGMEKKEYIRLVIEEMLPEVAEKKLARFCDVFCENFVFNSEESKMILEAGKGFGLLPLIHADEVESSGGAEVAGEVGAIAASHLLQPSDTGLKMMAEKGVIATLLPATALFLQERHKPPVKKMRELGIQMALGTDFNPGSSTLLAQVLTVQFACLYYGLTIVEALRGVTINAARALKMEREIGSIEPGKRADIVITDVPDYRHLAYRLGHNPVRMVLSRGKIVYHREGG
ncbi:MAG: imidazolonepropionase [candidate division WOR-3 bacterium]